MEIIVAVTFVAVQNITIRRDLFGEQTNEDFFQILKEKVQQEPFEFLTDLADCVVVVTPIKEV